MLDALEATSSSGGRLMYLGGNGFYWVTSIDPERPHADRGAPRAARDRHLASAPGRGLPQRRPASSAGCGATAAARPSGSSASAWRPRASIARCRIERQPGSFDPRAAFIFDGVGPTSRSATSASSWAAPAALEIDRLDHALGTPPHALVLATATASPTRTSTWSRRSSRATREQGGTVSPFVRGDMVFFETPERRRGLLGGSIAWCGGALVRTATTTPSRGSRRTSAPFRGTGAGRGEVAPAEVVVR